MRIKNKKEKGIFPKWRGRLICLGCGLGLFLLTGTSNTHTRIQVDSLKMESAGHLRFSYDETVKAASDTVSHMTIGVTGEYVNLRWQSPKTCDGYYIERKTEGEEYERIGVRNAKQESAYSDRKVSPGEEYTYRIRPYRNTAGVTYIENGYETRAVSVPLATPVITSLVYEDDYSGIFLEWKNIPQADWYEVYEKQNGTWQIADTTKESQIRIPADAEQQSEYRIRAAKQCEDRILYSDMEEKGVSVSDGTYRDLHILFDGDSIAMGKGYEQLSVCPISCRVGTILGCEVKNQAVSLSVSGPREGRELPNMYERVRDGEASYEGYDVVCLGMGTNDFTFNVPLGTRTDTEQDGTFYGYMKYIVQTIHQQNPGALIVLQTPPYRLRVGSSYEMAGWDSPNRARHTMEDYQEALVEIAGMKDYVYAYVSQDADIINERNADTILYDGLHPCDEGYARIGNDFARYLKDEVLIHLSDPVNDFSQENGVYGVRE